MQDSISDPQFDISPDDTPDKAPEIGAETDVESYGESALPRTECEEDEGQQSGAQQTAAAPPADEWQNHQVTVIWKGVETVMRHMIGLLDKIDAGVEALRDVGSERVGRALEDNAMAIDRMRKQLREGIARLDQQLVVYAAQSTTQAQDLRRQMRALEAQVVAMAAAQKAPTGSDATAWVEALMVRIEDRISAQAASAAQERIADLELQLSALQREIATARPAAMPLDGAAQELRLLLAELIASQERDQKEGRAA